MSQIVYQSDFGWVLRPHLYTLGDAWHWPASAFDVLAPYTARTKQHVSKALPVEQGDAGVDAPNVRKRKRSKQVKSDHVNKQNGINELHSSICHWLSEAHASLVLHSGTFPLPTTAAVADTSSGASIDDLDFIKFRELADIADSSKHALESEETDQACGIVPVDDVSRELDISSLYHQFISNDSDECKTLPVLGHSFIVPPHSVFLMSDLSQAQLLRSLNPFDFILMDPPWPNKSVRRAGKYQEIDIYDLFRLPLKHLIKPGGCLAVWVTNKPKYQRFVRDKLFSACGLAYVAEWYWLKVTLKGEWVVDLDSLHRKPYEVLIIGRAQHASNSHPDPVASLPTRRAICSVPSKHHSRKPLLDDAIAPFLPRDAQKLEIFARNLLPGWTSWGNEVLRFNDVQYLTQTTEGYLAPPPTELG
ncbi:uncharacterized protein SPPG_04738 [Spizellomyces punctatus DAOM BR117]|uniref:MT-A70-domain-containing protein n=1 Tax=Spizellomyces punctatus (strain DAOM BR117) TaxID=645134 RepID=A0A0L0HFZ9_SPIPD|nr:uncharacterized protein SPPG_04738 [Spizellomyces punctatus DAOM BR117]KND00416.1 hypothetical protein SPPG_04738 [Spizellomyces punctatus DAOM BR117]|eukprot:XP_016608455.1 hypothetical protein SPPG_04738 [Spizellomyces punctatus DAOM BR117]